MTLEFVTPTKLSLLDITTMGDSEKLSDISKIGTFGSGLKYAIALLLRNDVHIHIFVHDPENVEIYTFQSHHITDGSKAKNVIAIRKETKSISTGLCYDVENIITGFALQLGYNWDLWMAFRELASNTIDEGGYMATGRVKSIYPEGTTVMLDFPDGSDFHNIWENRSLYVNQGQSKYTLKNVDVLDNPDGFLKIYKQDILVHSNEDVCSKWAYNIHFGELDERRTLLNVDDVKTKICYAIAQSTDPVFIAELISTKDHFECEDFIWDCYSVYDVSSAIVKRAHDVVDFHTLPWINKLIRKKPDCQLPGREVTTLQDSMWASCKSIKIESIPQAPPKELTFRDKVLQHYKFDIGELEIKVADMIGGKCFADKYNKCLIISNDFNIQEDMPEFVIQYFDYIRDRRESLLTIISNEYCKLIGT